MDREVVLENQTVLIKDNLILAINPVEEAQVPDEALILEGNGAYLIPGLADMHVHLFAWDPDPHHLVLYLAQGTTTVRSLGEAHDMLTWREQVRNGELDGPTIYSTGRVIIGNHDNYMGFDLISQTLDVVLLVLPLLIGLVMLAAWKPAQSKRNLLIGAPLLLIAGVALLNLKPVSTADLIPGLFPQFTHGFLAETVDQAITEVRNQRNLQVDGIKLYDGLTENTFLEALAEAKRQNLYVHAHLLDQMDLEVLLDTGVDEVVHVDEFNSFHWNKPSAEVVADFEKGINPTLNYNSISQSAAMMARSDIALVSNLSTDEVSLQLIRNTPEVLLRPSYRIVRPEVLETWRTQGRPVTSWIHQGDYRATELPFFNALLSAMHEAGVMITIGTDSAQLVEGSLPSNIHRELELLVEAGFSNYEALSMGTRNAGLVVDRMGRDGNFGTVSIGNRADLILLERNPLENISHTRQRIGVMVRGQWFTQAELDSRVDDYVKRF
ncbi:MAG: amidohydrolase family protein [Gammaproteobacteria bacterium]|nr:amidohydrolase family protein [Gammaproteobacteria bacterium]